MTLFLGMTDAGAIPTARHYLHDAHGTPVAITTDQGAIAQRSAYDVWGNPTRVETLDTGLNAHPNRIGYTGYVLDLEGSRTDSGAAASANSPVGNARYYAKARHYGAGRGSFISVDPWEGDPTSPVSLNKYLYAYANPGIYIDPDGRIGFLTDLRDRFDRTDAILRQNAVEAEGTAGLLGYSLLRGLAAAGSAIPRALNVASDAVAQALPGETFSGVRADGAAEFGNVVDTGAYVVANPGQVVKDIHGNAVQTTVALAEGDRGAASDAISFFGQLGGGAAAGRALGFGAGAAPNAPKTIGEGADGSPAVRYIDPAMADELADMERGAGRGIDVVHSLQIKVPFGSGIGKQGYAYENALAGYMPARDRLPKNFKTFDFFDQQNGIATSAKTLDTTTDARIADPRRVLSVLRDHVDAAADFEAYRLGRTSLSSDDIVSRTVRVAVPLETNAEQWAQIQRAIEYANERGVRLTPEVVTNVPR
jgi:RHS repeat-associated protein